MFGRRNGKDLSLMSNANPGPTQGECEWAVNFSRRRLDRQVSMNAVEGMKELKSQFSGQGLIATEECVSPI